MDVGKMQQAKAPTVESLTGGIEYLLKKHMVDYLVGKGSLSGPNQVQVGDTTLDTKHVTLATGSEVSPLPRCWFGNGECLESTRLGSNVTVIEYTDRLCPAIDKEITEKFQQTLKKQGFEFQLKRPSRSQNSAPMAKST